MSNHKQESYNAIKEYSIHTVITRRSYRLDGLLRTGPKAFHNTTTPAAFDSLDAQTSRAYAYMSQPARKLEPEVSREWTRYATPSSATQP